MANVEAIKYVSQLNGIGCMVIKYQIFMTNLMLSFDLIDNQFGITIGFKILYLHLSDELQANK